MKVIDKSRYIKPSVKIKKSRVHILYTIGLQLSIIIVMGGIASYYCHVHDISWPFYIDQNEFKNFDFLGREKGKPVSFASILEEAFFWGLLGVLTKEKSVIIYSIFNDTEKQFNFLLNVARILGNLGLGMGISMAMISLLFAVKFSIAGISFTLNNPTIESVIAVSFILGFFHSDFKTVLEKLKGNVVKKMDVET